LQRSEEEQSCTSASLAIVKLNLEERLQRLQQKHPLGSKGFTKAGIRKMIARLHEELALYEGEQEAHQADSL
jgi:hypothetical protein